jgi:molybdate transport system substrate-binding protein
MFCRIYRNPAKMRALALCLLIAPVLALLPANPADAATVHVAVAANFTGPAREIAALFENKTGDTAELSFGSTGQLFTQISQGAPFGVFLAADEKRPQMAVDEGFAVPGSLFTYAVGRIALYSADPNRVTGPQSLTTPLPDKVAVANPALAPYGMAAIETMKNLGVYDRLMNRLVQGENIAQAFQFVQTGNAELGFVALSQIADATDGSRWVVPKVLYTPIRQDAVLLTAAGDDPAAKAFLAFLKSNDAKAVIAKYGYATAQ